MTCFSIVRFENSILRRNASREHVPGEFPVAQLSQRDTDSRLWRKAGSTAISQTIESGHISLPASGTSPASSPVNSYRTKNQARNSGLCVPARRASTGADGVQRDGANFQRDGRAAPGEWRGSRTNSYPKLFHSIASNIRPEPAERRVTQV